MKTRLDIYLVEKGLVETRNKAQALIMAGQVLIDGQLIDKPGTKVSNLSAARIVEPYPYVSRGATKLEKAYQEFNLSLVDKIICDVGSSTGGFTDLVLQKGAKRVYAIDVGRGQLDQKLRRDERVIVMEKTDFRTVEQLPDQIDLFVCDVSFISLTKILPRIKSLTADYKKHKCEIVALIKPQFEAGAKEVSQGKGVIKSEQKRLEIVDSIKEFVQKLGFEILGITESPITGAKGNVEFLIYVVVP